MFSTRTEVKREPCRRCQILRVYLAMILGVIVFGVLARDLLDGLAGLTPQMFGYAFAGLPIILFAAKFWAHKRKSAETAQASDHAPAGPPAADTGKTGHSCVRS